MIILNTTKGRGDFLEKYLEQLASSLLFKSIEKSKIPKILKTIPYTVKSYKKDEVIAVEGEDCHSLGIILEGRVEIHKPFPSGKVVTINHFSPGNVFGEALVFSDQHLYPATVISSEPAKILYIQRQDIIRLMSYDERIIDNFMRVLSNRILMLSDRITNLSYDTLRKKIANALLFQYNKQKSKTIILPYSRKKMAELLNIPRPSLSRELIKMQEEGIITFHRNKVEILDLKSLEDSLI